MITQEKILYMKDLRRLRPRTRDTSGESWLTNSIVDYTVSVTLKNFFPTLMEKCTILPSVFLPQHDKKQRTLRDFVIWPSLIEKHFCVICYEKDHEKTTIYNSLHGTVTKTNEVVKSFKNYLEKFNCFTKKIIVPRNVPQQRNVNDCGLYCILFTEQLLGHIFQNQSLTKVKFIINKGDVEMKRRCIFDLIVEDYLKNNKDIVSLSKTELENFW